MAKLIDWRSRVAISDIQERLIIDNPNLSTNVIARFLGVDKSTVRKVKQRMTGHRHSFKGNSIPHLTSEIYNGGFRYVAIYRGRKLGVGSFSYCIEQVDRLLFCLENNNGKLPPTFNDVVFGNLKFGEAR